MEMSSSQTIPAPQQRTWEALNDPETLKICIPGCDSIEKVSDTEYHLSMAAKVGPVSARFKGKMTLSDVNAPNAYKVVFEGQGGAAGFAKGSADVRLVPESAEATRLEYTVHAQVGGKLAQIGSRLIDGAAKKMADQFFTAFAVHLSQHDAETDAEPGDAAAPPSDKKRWAFWRKRDGE